MKHFHRGIRILLGLAALFTSSQGFGKWDLPTKPFLGGVEIPSLFLADEASNRGREHTVTLYSEPDRHPAIKVVIRDPRQLEGIEHGEGMLAVVSAKSSMVGGPWYRVRYSFKGRIESAWLSAKDAGRFYMLHELLNPAMTYLTPAWDGRLREIPGWDQPSKAVQGLAHQKRPEAPVASFAWIGEDIWVLVVVTRGSVCTGDRRDRGVVASGWIPAFDKAGKLNVWFYPGGC